MGVGSGGRSCLGRASSLGQATSKIKINRPWLNSDRLQGRPSTPGNRFVRLARPNLATPIEGGECAPVSIPRGRREPWLMGDGEATSNHNG